MDKLIVIPVYNEEKKISELLYSIRHFSDAYILAINDGSTDNSPKILEKLADEILTHDTRLGYGQSLIDGFRYAIQNKHEYVITIDADGQHDPRMIPIFFSEIPTFDMITGSRYHPLSPIITLMSKIPYNINLEIIKFLKTNLCLEITDAFCGFRAYKVSSLFRLCLTITDYAFPLQMWVQIVKHKLIFKEIPIPLIVYNYGESHPRIPMLPKNVITYYKRIILEEMKKQGLVQYLQKMPCL